MKTADPELMRAINRFHVMDAIRRFGPISRVEISHLTELSATTVSAITAALLDDRLIIPLQVGAVRDAGRGRPRVMLKLNPDAAFVVGVKLAPDQITVAVDQFLRRRAAHARRCRSASTGRRPRSSPIWSRMACAAASATPVSRWPTSPASASACPASSSGRRASAARARSSSERDVNFGADLTQRLGVPVSIDSDVNLVTLAEHWFGQARELNDFLVVNVEHSLGLGILHNGELFRGANGLSPDFGDLMVRPPGSGGGRLADVASEASVLGEAEALMREREPEAAPHAGRAMALFLQRAAAGRPALRAACSPRPARRSVSRSPT